MSKLTAEEFIANAPEPIRTELSAMCDYMRDKWSAKLMANDLLTTREECDEYSLEELRDQVAVLD